MERIGFVGLGTMGSSMAANLLRAGAQLTVWNRTRGRAAALVQMGAHETTSPADVAARSDITVVCVSDTPDVQAVLFGAAGISGGARPGSLVIDCSTISPEATREFGRRLGRQGVGMVDAPVSGGSEGARLGTLTMFVGGADRDVARARLVLEAVGKTITHLGPLGSGQAAKAVNQVIISGTYLGVAEGIALGIEAGLDPDRLIEALSAGAAQSWVLANRSGRMVDDDYPLGFRLALHRKDLGIALHLAKGLGLDLPATALTSRIEDELIAAGRGDDDMSALAHPLRKDRRGRKSAAPSPADGGSAGAVEGS